MFPARTRTSGWFCTKVCELGSVAGPTPMADTEPRQQCSSAASEVTKQTSGTLPESTLARFSIHYDLDSPPLVCIAAPRSGYLLSQRVYKRLS